MNRSKPLMVLVLTAILFLICFVQIEAKDKQTYIFSEETVKDNYKGADLKISYPNIGGNIDLETKRAFNIRTNNIIGSYLRDFKLDAATQSKDEKVEGVWILEIKNRVTMQSPTLLSLVIQGTATKGNGKNTYIYNTLLFDVKNGIFLELEDIFKPASNHLPVVSNYCTRVVRKQGKVNEQSIRKNLAPVKENYKLFYIAQEGVGFIFPPYTVGEEASGAREVIIPYDYLKKLINKQGYLGDFLK